MCFFSHTLTIKWVSLSINVGAIKVYNLRRSPFNVKVSLFGLTIINHLGGAFIQTNFPWNVN